MVRAESSHLDLRQVDRREKVLVAEGEGLLLPEIVVLGVELDDLGLGLARRDRAGPRQAGERDELLARDVVDLAVGLGVAEG